MHPCKTCKHEMYGSLPRNAGWICCDHPIAQAKRVRWAHGDPAWVNMHTADVKVDGEFADLLRDCPCWEERE